MSGVKPVPRHGILMISLFIVSMHRSRKFYLSNRLDGQLWLTVRSQKNEINQDMNLQNKAVEKAKNTLLK